MTHKEKMTAKKARRDVTNHTAYFARQLAEGKRIRLNFSLTPKGKPRTRNPIYDGVQL